MGHLQRGFTLVEMLIVIAIILILAAVALPRLEKARIKSHFVRVDAVSNGFAKALRECFAVHYEFKKCSDGYGHANDPNVLLAWAPIKDLQSSIANRVSYTENDNQQGKEVIAWDIPVLIPGRFDTSGNPLESVYKGRFQRDPTNNSIETYSPAADSPCVQDGYCTPQKR